ncbi:MAG: hypothetical protein J5582_04960 [Ruminococcus sp.]|uniref:hypothetical protein n=1 Tax=Ruminococcus sp. TaxID=41978 RepID=UPI0025EF05C6|nr:hypothetical protein [Ruminococcus sp.]MBO4865903.1 hypothetical protein [Ruminococcus sp.]
MRPCRISALLIAGALMLPLVGCSNKTGDSSGSDNASSAKETKAVADKVELKDYKFPEFLNDIKQPDSLSRPVYVSFALSEYVSEVTEQPFEGYECSQMIENSLYVFSEGKYKGLLNIKGRVVLKADTYTSISLCNPGTLMLSRDKELNAPDEYMAFNIYGTVRAVSTPEFKPDNISIEEETKYKPVASNEDEARYKAYNLTMGDGITVGEGSAYVDWDKIESVSAQSINTSRPYNAYYRVQKGEEIYYICFDRFYNYTIYNGAYGFVRMKVGEGYGGCYILDHEDYSELNKLIESFGESGPVKSPSKDTGLDYVQIETGYGTDDIVTMTISADGYCFTEHLGSGDQQPQKYFTILDKESFVSLVKWVDQVLSEEYKK